MYYYTHKYAQLLHASENWDIEIDESFKYSKLILCYIHILKYHTACYNTNS